MMEESKHVVLTKKEFQALKSQAVGIPDKISAKRLRRTPAALASARYRARQRQNPA